MGTTALTDTKARAQSRNARKAVPACLVMLSGVWTVPASSEVNFWPIVTIGATYTDNVTLAGSGLEQDDTLVEVAPGFLLEAEERRFDIYTEYTAQALFYSENSDADEVYQQADLEASLKIVPERFFLEATGSHGQQVVDPEQTFSFSNLSLTANRTDATQYEIGPRLFLPLGNAYALQVSARHSEVLYDDPSIADASGDEGDFSFGNLQAAGAFAWELYGEAERLEYEIGPEIEYQQAGLRARLGSTSLAFLALAGMESDYDTPSEGSLEEEFWEIGVAWNGSNYALEAGFGERSFGNTYRISLSAQTNSLSARIGYSETPSTPARVQQERRAFSGSQTDRFLDRPGSTERFVRKLFEADLVFPMSDGALTVSGTYERRDDRFSLVDSAELSDEQLTTLDVGWNRELGLRTAIDVSGSWARRDFGTQLGEDDVYEVGATLLYRLGRRSTILLRYTRTEQDSDGVSNRDDYTENLVSLYFTWSTSNAGRQLSSGRPRRSFD